MKKKSYSNGKMDKLDKLILMKETEHLSNIG